MLVRPHDGVPARELATAQVAVLGVMGEALLDAGSLDPALDLARRMPEGMPRMGLLAAVASMLRTRNDADARGRALAREVRDAAEVILTDLRASTAVADQVSAMWTAQLAVEIVARWEGAEAAISFVRETMTADRVDWTLGKVSDRLAGHGERELARSVAPEPDPTDAEQLLTAATRLRRLGHDDRAGTMARQVVRLVI